MQRYGGDYLLAQLVLDERNEGCRRRALDECFRIISCEIGYRLGQSWGSLEESRRMSIAQSVVNTPFALLGEFPDKAKEMLLTIVDVALEQIPVTIPTERAQLCSALIMAIGFQDDDAKLHLLYPLLDLMGGACPHTLHYTDIINHQRTALGASTQRAYLTRRVARELIWWRDSGAEILHASCAQGWLPREHDVGNERGLHILLQKINSNSNYVGDNTPVPLTRIVNITPKESPSARLPSLPPPAKLPKVELLQSHASLTGTQNLFRCMPLNCQVEVQNSSKGDPAVSPSLSAAQLRTTITAVAPVIDVSAIIAVTIPSNSIITGGRLVVCAGLGCALLHDATTLIERIVPLTEMRGDAYKASTIRCFFEDYGEAWEYCCTRPTRSTLVGRGFLMAPAPKGGWRVIIGASHGLDGTAFRPWHVLAFHVILGLPVRGLSEDSDSVGGIFSLLVWICERVHQGLGLPPIPQLRDKEGTICPKFVPILVHALVDVDVAPHNYANCDVLMDFLTEISKKLSKSGELKSALVTSVINEVLEGVSQQTKDTLHKCGLFSSSAQLRDAISCSLSRLVENDAITRYLNPGAKRGQSHPVTEKLFEAPLTSRDLRNRLLTVLERQWASDQEAQALMASLMHISTEVVPAAEPMPTPYFVPPAQFNTATHAVDNDISPGTGMQSGDRHDVFFCLANSYDAAELTCIPVERKEKYHHTAGLVIGFLLDKRILNIATNHQANDNEALVVQWILQVLRSPLSVMWKEWFMLHLCSTAVWGLHVPLNNVEARQHQIIAHLLAWRCEHAIVREVVVSAFGELPFFCARSNGIYGVIAMFNPSISDWVSSGYDAQEHRFAAIPEDEEVFRTLVARFNPMTTHVVVYGFDKSPMSDTLLKWLCEYTFRYPWRFFILVNCDTTSNLPEIRDRVTNLMPLRNRVADTITLSIDDDAQDDQQFVKYLPSTEQERTCRSCNWSEDVEDCLKNAKEHHSVLLLHLISPPGGGKSTLMQDLEAKKSLGTFIRFDCSDDRLVEEALRALLGEVLAGVDTQRGSIILVADEYHMLPDRKKEEFMCWAQENLKHVKIVMIANRASPLDKKLLATLLATYRDSKGATIRCIEGRISAFKVKVVIRKTYDTKSPSDEQRAAEQSKKFYTFLSTLRGMLGDDAVSLRLEKHFPRAATSQTIDNSAFMKQLQDKLIAFGFNSIFRIVSCYQQIIVNVEGQTANLTENERREVIVRVYKGCFDGSPTKLLVFTSMLVPLLLYVEPDLTSHAINTHQKCDEALCYRDVVELTGSVRRAPVAVRLAMWVRYVTAFVGVSLTEIEHAVIFKSLQRLNVVDFPDFPIIQGESSLKLYPLSKQTTTFVHHHDLGDLDWIFRTLSRRVAINWLCVKASWALSPVTDSEKLCTIIDQAGPTTVFMAMHPTNVLQLQKRNPHGLFTKEVIRSYPISRIKDEATSLESPYFFAVYTHLATLEDPTDQPLQNAFRALVWLLRGTEDREVAKSFIFWVARHGSVVASVPDLPRERTEAIVRLVVTMTVALEFSREEHAAVWREKYLAPVAELFAERLGQDPPPVLIPIVLAVDIAKGATPQQKLHDKWPPTIKLIHRVVSSSSALLSEREATYLLDIGILDQPTIPPRLVGALLQAEPHGWLRKEHQLKLLGCDVTIGAGDMNNEDHYVLHACRNVMLGLRAITNPSHIKLRYPPIQRLYDDMTAKKKHTHVKIEGRKE